VLFRTVFSISLNAASISGACGFYELNIFQYSPPDLFFIGQTGRGERCYLYAFERKLKEAFL
jgi:hypothetical protein